MPAFVLSILTNVWIVLIFFEWPQPLNYFVNLCQPIASWRRRVKTSRRVSMTETERRLRRLRSFKAKKRVPFWLSLKPKDPAAYILAMLSFVVAMTSVATTLINKHEDWRREWRRDRNEALKDVVGQLGAVSLDLENFDLESLQEAAAYMANADPYARELIFGETRYLARGRTKPSSKAMWDAYHPIRLKASQLSLSTEAYADVLSASERDRLVQIFQKIADLGGRLVIATQPYHDSRTFAFYDATQWPDFQIHWKDPVFMNFKGPRSTWGPTVSYRTELLQVARDLERAINSEIHAFVRELNVSRRRD